MATEPFPPPDPDLDLMVEEVVTTPVESPADQEYTLPGADIRERALPIRPGDLTRLLLAQPGLSAEDHRLFAEFGPMLGSYFHHEFYQRLRDLKETYGPLDPDSDYARIANHSKHLHDTLDEEFLGLFEATLERANYRLLRAEVILEAIAAPNETGLNYVPDFSLFEHLRVYVRGFTKLSRVSRNLKSKFRKRTVILDGYQRLIVVMKFKEGILLGPNVRSDVLYLRMFKDVPHVDMEMHLPEQGTKVKMRWVDKAQIASPLIVGLPTVAMKLLLATTLLNPAILGTAVFAPLSAGINSFFGFQRAKSKHLSNMIRSLYYLTLANNGSVLTRLIDSAEEEEFKETLLSYFFLLREKRDGPSSTMNGLDIEIEQFLLKSTGHSINFEVQDALSKLYRLGLARHDSEGRIQAVPLVQAIDNLEHLWKGSLHKS